jgi:ferredoxin
MICRLKEMNVKIDQDECIKCEACEQTCSEVFVVENGQKAYIVEKYRKNAQDTGEVPDTLVSSAKDAAVSCSVQVISIR